MNRLNHLCAVLDARLLHFAAGPIDLREEPYSGFLDVNSNPYFPKLYISGKRDKSIMSMPGEGTAMVSYKVQRRNIDETKADGARYGADIEIRSIEPVAEEPAGEGAELASRAFLREFARGDVFNRVVDKWAKRQGPGLRKMTKEAMNFPIVQAVLKKDVKGMAKAYEIPVREAKSLMPGLRKSTASQTRNDRNSGVFKGTFKNEDELIGFKRSGAHQMRNPDATYANPLKVAKKFMAKDPVAAERKRAAMFRPKTDSELASADFLHHFAGTRDRDAEGRFDSGTVARTDDYALAMAPKKKLGMGKKLLIGAGAGLVAGGAMIARRKLDPSLLAKMG